jgi:HSP20 family protein
MADKTMIRAANAPARAEDTTNGKQFAPRVDICETPSEILLLADLPGVAPTGIDLRYENGELTLRGRLESPEHKGRPVLEEYETGDYYRVFQLHEAIDANRIEAEFKNGVLTVHLPKPEAAKPKQVQIKAN